MLYSLLASDLIYRFNRNFRKEWIHMITWSKALLLGHSLESWIALVFCDGCRLLFYLMHKSCRVSVQGKKVCSGAHQTPKVGRPAPQGLGLRSLSTLTWNVSEALLRCYPPSSSLPPSLVCQGLCGAMCERAWPSRGICRPSATPKMATC